MFSSLEVEVLTQPDGGEGLAKRKGIVVRQCLNEAWSKCASRWTRTGYRREHRTSGPLTMKSISIKGAERRFGGCARKAVELTSGGLDRVRTGLPVRCTRTGRTEEAARLPDRDAEVSSGHSRASEPEGPNGLLIGVKWSGE